MPGHDGRERLSLAAADHPAADLAAAAAGPGAVVVLDGGLATALEAAGHDLSGRLWSARLLRDDPAAVEAAHRAYLRAGAQVVTTASYQASEQGFALAGVDSSGARSLLATSVRLARAACDAYASGAGGGTAVAGPPWVAASVGPYGAVLADGSEYRGDYGLPVAALRAFHRPRLEVLAGAGPDVLACETVPCLAEWEALLAEVERLGVPAWLSLTVEGERTRLGEAAAEAFGMARGVVPVVAVGVNCCDPAGLARVVALAARCSGKPVVAYPNSGERWDSRVRAWLGPSRFRAADAPAWVAAGARLVGGCCRVGPDDIAALARELRGGA